MERKGPVDLLKNRKSLSKSVIPMRHNTNRGASVNHNALSAQLSELKTPKTLTVIPSSLSTTWEKGTTRP